MNWVPISMPLQHQNARDFRIDRIIFDDNRIGDAGEYFTYGQRVFRQFIISVIGNNDATIPDKFQDFPKAEGLPFGSPSAFVSSQAIELSGSHPEGYKKFMSVL